MKKFNINEYIYIQITKQGWDHLEKTVGADYILHWIKAPEHEAVIDGKIWYRLQMHEVFSLLSNPVGGPLYFGTEIMFVDKDLKEK